MYKFGKSSREKLKGVHPDLVKVMERAISISKQDFSITQGVRTKSEQTRLVAQGKSKTMNSKHLVQRDGYSHAVDVVPFPVSWDLEKFYVIADAVEKAAEQLNVKIRWGGAWTTFVNGIDDNEKELVQRYSANKRKLRQQAFIDAPHFELA